MPRGHLPIPHQLDLRSKLLPQASIPGSISAVVGAGGVEVFNVLRIARQHRHRVPEVAAAPGDHQSWAIRCAGPRTGGGAGCTGHQLVDEVRGGGPQGRQALRAARDSRHRADGGRVCGHDGVDAGWIAEPRRVNASIGPTQPIASRRHRNRCFGQHFVPVPTPFELLSKPKTGPWRGCCAVPTAQKTEKYASSALERRRGCSTFHLPRGPPGNLPSIHRTVGNLWRPRKR